MSSHFSRSLPPHPDLGQQRKQAKELLAAFRAGEPDAVARVRAALPDKPQITLADAQFVIAREYGFASWATLARHIQGRSPAELLHEAFSRHDAPQVDRLFRKHPELRARIDDPVFPFDAPALVALADDPAMVEVLLAHGADPNRRSEWWAGPFHSLHVATGAAAERLLAAGAIPDACAAAHLDRPELLQALLSASPDRVRERGGDGQTPLHFARSRAVIDLLLDAGADIDARDVDHRATPAEWMLGDRRDLARYLVDRGARADIFLVASLGLASRAREMLREQPGLLELRTGRGEYGERGRSSYHIYLWSIGDGRSPLDVATGETLAAMLEFASPQQRLLSACIRGDEAGARQIVREHAGLVASMTPEDQRAISDAAWHGHARAVSLMLDLGFDPRTPGHDGGSALHCAAWQGAPETVAALLRHPDARELVVIRDRRYGATPLGWCCHGSLHGNPAHDHPAVARLLLDAGARPGPDTTQASPAVLALIGD